MDNELRENDPYQEMKQKAKKDIRPGFLNRTSDNAKSEKARKELGEAESVAGGGLYKRNDAARDGEENPNGFRYTGKGKQPFTGKKSKFKMAKISAAVTILLGVLMLVVVVATIGGPIFMIGNLDYNLQDALGFTGTIGILEKQAEYVVGDEMARGEVPDGLAGKLAAHGLTVGQVASNGDFVRTNVYLADIDQLKDVAVLGNFQTQATEEGQLAMLYDNEVIRADEFVAAVESNPKMYGEFSEAIEIGALYWYESNDVDAALRDAGVTRSMFVDWTDKGDEEENREQFKDIVEGGINVSSSLQVGGFDTRPETSTYQDDQGNEQTDIVSGSYSTDISGEATGIVDQIASDTRDYSSDQATKEAAQLLNTAISASEPYAAASSFMMIEEAIQRARIEGDGPVNEVMNLLNQETEITYTDMSTGEEKTSKNSILTTPNFVAAVSAGKYSGAEAASFSRDRALLATRMDDRGVITDTVVDTSGQKKSNIVIGMGHEESADRGALSVLDSAVDIAMVKKNSELLTSTVGGNRIVEGGAFISNMVNTRAIGAMGSDEATIAAYHKEVEDVLARKAEAERATKSPFDISSPYTFMGSLARSLANAIVRNRATSTGGTVVGTIASLTGDSVKSSMGSVIADGKDDSYEMTHGGHCETVNSAANIEGDIYCTAQTTVSTGYMKRGKEEWESVINEDDYKDFVNIGMNRQATVGVNSAEACKQWRQKHNNVMSGISELFGIYEVCRAGLVEGVIDDVFGDGGLSNLENVAIGSYYAISDSNSNSQATKEMAGYALYDQVSSLLEGNRTTASIIREEYYAEHPQDNSKAGRLARISGLTKEEAEIALAYADYLTVIANYNPAERYAFGGSVVEVSQEPQLVEHANQVASELYVVWHGRTEYDDLRGRTRVA